MSRWLRQPGLLHPSLTMLATAGVIALLGVPATKAASLDQSAESAALFMQLAPVFQHPRCMNCHTGEDFPRQGDDAHRHRMNITRGSTDTGAAGLRCSTCHQSTNQTASGVPGAAAWGLAPVRMKWSGMTEADLCRALLDPARGAMQPAQFVPHFNSSLVRWAWAPGSDARGHIRTRPQLDYPTFVRITRQWVATGAACPR